GSHVIRRSDEIVDRSHGRMVYAFCDAEIDDVRFTICIDQDILWLQIAVNDSTEMCVIDSLGKFCHQGCRLLWTPYLCTDMVGKSLSPDQLHRVVWIAVIFTTLVDLHD